VVLGHLSDTGAWFCFAYCVKYALVVVTGAVVARAPQNEKYYCCLQVILSPGMRCSNGDDVVLSLTLCVYTV
jgi:hypothetical protein